MSRRQRFPFFRLGILNLFWAILLVLLQTESPCGPPACSGADIPDRQVVLDSEEADVLEEAVLRGMVSVAPEAQGESGLTAEPRFAGRFLLLDAHSFPSQFVQVSPVTRGPPSFRPL